jgi:hypothetical protein
LFSLGIGAFDDDPPFAAAASFRALRSKKLAIVYAVLAGDQMCASSVSEVEETRSEIVTRVRVPL